MFFFRECLHSIPLACCCCWHNLSFPLSVYIFKCIAFYICFLSFIIDLFIRLFYLAEFFWFSSLRILEYLIGTAAGSAAISSCLDALFDGVIKAWMQSLYGTFFGHVPDLLAATITLLMTCLLAAGVKKSLTFNNVLNVLNFGAWAILVMGALFYVDTDNWSEHGGFLPFGWSGVLKGAAVAFYAFIGFDIIATTGEEAECPQRSIPTAIVASMTIALVAYVSAGLLVTLLVPYENITAGSSIVAAFEAVGASKLKLIAVLGALAGLVVSMFGSMVSLLLRDIFRLRLDGIYFVYFH